MLSPYRVLDLTDHRGQLAGALLAALGAEVIAVEPPEGSPSRRRGPLHGELSLSWWAHNRAKRSVVVDSLDGADFERLVRGADVLIDNAPGGPDPARLARINPQLVHVTVSPFGLDGPKADWPASDLTVLAAACQLAVTGDPDRPPVRTAVPQAWMHAGAEAACAALLALHQRLRSDVGQRVDVSAQLATMMAAVPATIFAPNGAADVQRMGGGIRTGFRNLRFVYPAADGYVSIMHNFSAASGPYTVRLMHWAHDEGHCDATMRDVDWLHYGEALVTGAATDEHFDEAKAAVAALTGSKTKAELFAEARRRPLLLAPVLRVDELLDSEQLAARRYWDELDDPDLGPVRAPGHFVHSPQWPAPALGGAPRLGADTGAVLAGPQRSPAPSRPDADHPARPLEGVKVLDLSWVYAGPLATRMLADFGATVVKVESPNRPDSTRGSGPYFPGDLGPEGSIQFNHFNAGKLGLALDLATEAGRTVLADLVRWADVVVDSFTPGVMAGWGFGHDRLVELNPQVVAISTSLMGATGPLATFAGFGNLAGAVTGFYDLTGWADRAPTGPFLAYTDYLAPRFLAATVLAALDHRRRTGSPVTVDLAQQECAIWFLAPAVLEWTVSGNLLTRAGNTDRYVAPHGVYPTAGDDTWLAVACETDEQWTALCTELDRPDWAVWPVATRLARATEIDAAVTAWSAGLDGEVAQAGLIGAGIAAHIVQNSSGCVADPQLVHRDHFRRVPHPKHGSVVVEGPRARLCATPGRVERAAPMVGEHVGHVLTGLLGYDADTVADLVVAGALG